MVHTSDTQHQLKVPADINKDELDEIWEDCMSIRDFDELTPYGQELLCEAEAMYETKNWLRPSWRSDGYRIEDFD